MAETPVAWPFPPLAPLVETLEWRTEVLAARDGEQRVAMRPVPRVLLTLRHRLDAADYARATALLRANAAGEWEVTDWRLMDEAGAAPLRRAILAGAVEIERERRGRSVLSATFLLRDPGGAAASPYPAHAGAPVLTDRMVVRRPLAERVAVAAEYVDGGAGPVVVEPTRSFQQQGFTVSTVDHRAAARDARRAWLMSVRGRQRSWWLPSWGGELVLRSGLIASDTIMAVEPAMPLDAYAGRHAMLDLPGAPVFREIVAAAEAGGAHWLTIAPPGVAVPADTPVHLMARARLDADRIELRHFGPRTEMTAPAIEVPA